MPKIVIREFDKTTASSGAYSNFTVVVPGFIQPGTWADTNNIVHDYGYNEKNESVFDENGVYECSSKTDFKKYIGQISGQNIIVQPAVPPVIKAGTQIRSLTGTDFNKLVTGGKLYVVTENTKSAPVGEYADKDYIYTKAIAEGNTYTFLPENPDATTKYTLFVELDHIGTNELTDTHYGNQIAYELLGLGYTILYKKLDKVSDLSDSTFWGSLKDKSIYDFRYIISGCRGNSAAVNNAMINLAEFNKSESNFDDIDTLEDVGRGDCVALLDIDTAAYEGKNQTTAISDVLDTVGKSSKYAAYFAPYITYKEVDESTHYGNNKTFPASFHYLACAAKAAENFNEWYAIAGYTRGISKYVVSSVGCKFGEAAVNAFQPRSKTIKNSSGIAINPIIQLRGSTYLWGNRTAELLGDKGTSEGDLKASHFLNIRQLCTTIKKQVYVACRQSSYDPNSETLWTNFCNTIRPVLEKMKADQGIEDYKFIKVKNDRKAFLSAVIRIVPIEAVEDFDISIYLEDSLNGTIAVETEE